MKITNLSAEVEGKLRGWLPHNLEVEEIVFLPDACPGKSPLPTGTAVYTKQKDWRQFALSDCGCGMRLLKSSIKSNELTQELWDRIAYDIQANKGGLGDLGGGNHFLDALLPYDEDNIYFLVHTGSRKESGLVDEYIDQPAKFNKEFTRVVEWAKDNRGGVQSILENNVGNLELIMDLPHNTFEELDDGVIIRKGSVKLNSGELTVLPSHMSGDVVLVKATNKIDEILCSMSHGTGRTMSRGNAKNKALEFDFEALRKMIMMPSFLKNASLTTEGPFAYRELDDCLNLINGYVEEVKRFSVIAYAGHL